MIEVLLELPSHLRQRLADALDAQLLDLSSPPAAVRATLGLGDDDSKVVVEALREWKRLEISGAAAATWLKSLEQVVTRVATPDFVWSGPKVTGLYSRDTRQVYEELMSTASQSIWASTYAYFDGPRAFETLASRMDAVPSLEVTLLLNIERRRGDTTAADHLVRRFADRFWGKTGRALRAHEFTTTLAPLNWKALPVLSTPRQLLPMKRRSSSPRQTSPKRP